jgi:hypothetical protein
MSLCWVRRPVTRKVEGELAALVLGGRPLERPIGPLGREPLGQRHNRRQGTELRIGAPPPAPSARRSCLGFADRLEQGADPRAERYWQLLAVINGRPPVPTTMPAWRWTIEALRARPEG